MTVRNTAILLLLAAATAASCARTATEGLNDASRRDFDAWIGVHYPNAERTRLGAYVIEDKPGTGALFDNIQDFPYIRLNYTVCNLEGRLQSTTIARRAQQEGTYSESTYYGPQILARGYDNIYAGLEEAFSTMREGGSRTLVIPGWLCSFGNLLYSEDWYLQNATGTSAIYYLEPVEQIRNIVDWEIDSIGRYVSRVYGKQPSDSLKNGFYYIPTAPSSEDVAFNKDTTIYVNYIGRLLDGTVFDTNVKDTAVLYGLSTSGCTPKSIEVKELYSETTMGSSSIIDGFAYAISQMHPFEKGTAVFWSGYGYSSGGSGNSIPGYSPLRFDIEVVDKE